MIDTQTFIWSVLSFWTN